MNQVELFAIVFQVAVHAIFAIGIAHLHVGVVAVLIGKGLSDLFVAIETFIGRSAGAEHVTTIALRGAAERFVGFGEGPWGNLRMGWKNNGQTARDRQEDREKKLSRNFRVTCKCCFAGRALVHQSLQV